MDTYVLPCSSTGTFACTLCCLPLTTSSNPPPNPNATRTWPLPIPIASRVCAATSSQAKKPPTPTATTVLQFANSAPLNEPSSQPKPWAENHVCPNQSTGQSPIEGRVEIQASPTRIMCMLERRLSIFLLVHHPTKRKTGMILGRILFHSSEKVGMVVGRQLLSMDKRCIVAILVSF